jgi:hypothetical protein
VQDRDGISATSTFSINVRPVNDAPTLAGLSDITIRSGEFEPVAPHPVTLSNITSGAFNENDDLLVTANSDNPGLFAAFTVEYSSPSTTGLLRFTPSTSTNGTAIVTVTVNDRQPNNNLVTRSFVLTVKPPLSLQISRLGSSVIISFDTITSESYTIEYKKGFSDASWTPLGPARAGTGSTLTVTDDISDASRFYRVRIE